MISKIILQEIISRKLDKLKEDFIPVQEDSQTMRLKHIFIHSLSFKLNLEMEQAPLNKLDNTSELLVLDKLISMK